MRGKITFLKIKSIYWFFSHIASSKDPFETNQIFLFINNLKEN